MSNQKKSTNLKDDYVIKGIYAEKIAHSRHYEVRWIFCEVGDNAQ